VTDEGGGGRERVKLPGRGGGGVLGGLGAPSLLLALLLREALKDWRRLKTGDGQSQGSRSSKPCIAKRRVGYIVAPYIQ